MTGVDWSLTLRRIHEDVKIGYWYDPRIYFCAVTNVDRSADPPIEWRIETERGETFVAEIGATTGRLLGIMILTYASAVHIAPGLIDSAQQPVVGLPAFEMADWPRRVRGGLSGSHDCAEELERAIVYHGWFALGIGKGSIMMRLSRACPSKCVVMDGKLFMGFDTDNRLCFVECCSVEESVTASVEKYFQIVPGW